MLCYRVKEEVHHYDTLHYATINIVYNQVLHIVSVQTDLVSLCVARLNFMWKHCTVLYCSILYCNVLYSSTL